MDIDMSALRALEREKEISFDLLVEAIESALLIAYHRTEGHQPAARVELDRKSGHVTVWAEETDEEGNDLREFDDTPTGFGRIAATTAKQVILQRLRDAEDEQTFGEFAGREGDIVSGVIQQGKDPRNVFVDLGSIEAMLPPPEQVPGEGYAARRAAALLRRAGAQGGARAVHHALAHAPQPGAQAVRPGGAGDRRRHGGDRGGRPRGRPPHQDRRTVDTPRRQRQGRLHRPDGRPGARRDGRAARREDRHRRLVGGPGDLRGAGAVAGPGEHGRDRRPRGPRRRGSSCPTTSCRWPSARRARTPASPRGSPAGGSTSGPTPSAPRRASSGGRTTPTSPRLSAPVRTCVGCRERADAADLLRVVARSGAPASRTSGDGCPAGAPICTRTAAASSSPRAGGPSPRALRVPGPLDDTAIRRGPGRLTQAGADGAGRRRGTRRVRMTRTASRSPRTTRAMAQVDHAPRSLAGSVHRPVGSGSRC